MKLMGGIVGSTKEVKFYCEMPVNVKDNSAINWKPGVYLIKKSIPILVLVEEKNASVAQQNRAFGYEPKG